MRSDGNDFSEILDSMEAIYQKCGEGRSHIIQLYEVEESFREE
jgi:hypothetical protein